jgi:hypothetical protein
MSVRVNFDSGTIDRGNYIALRFDLTSLKATGNLHLFRRGVRSATTKNGSHTGGSEKAEKASFETHRDGLEM